MNDRSSKRSRSRSPYRDQRKHRFRSSRDDRRNIRPRDNDALAPLPLNATKLTKQDLDLYRPMFALYLDIQKSIDIEELETEELRGRWKSFINKWNRGDLAEGWYDPSTLAKARNTQNEPTRTPYENARQERQRTPSAEQVDSATAIDAEEEDEDDYGPALPNSLVISTPVHLDQNTSTSKAGPTIPSLQDIQSRNEDARAYAEATREQTIKEAKQTRHLERTLQKSRLEEIAPHAEPGTRERQLEKKRDLADSNRTFAASKEAGGEVEIRDSDLMGGDELGELKRMKREQDRRKTEREIKREEILRARMAERGQKLKVMRDKEEKTMSMLREIARERFGSGNDQSATLRDDRDH